MGVLSAYLCTTCTHYPLKSEEGIRSHGTGVSDSCKWPRECWQWNPGSLGEQVVLMTVEPSLQPALPFLSLDDVGSYPCTCSCEVGATSKPSFLEKSSMYHCMAFEFLFINYFKELLIGKTAHKYS